MSYSTILHLYPGSETPAKHVIELQNSNGSAPVIWKILSERYLESSCSGYDSTFPSMVLTGLYRDSEIPKSFRAVLMMTFDVAYIAKKNLTRAAYDIHMFMQEFPQERRYVNHWPEIAKYYETDPDCEAVGIWQTSLSENPFEGDWDEEIDGAGPFDWDDAYEIYEDLDS